jgi:hypothetical protein
VAAVTVRELASALGVTVEELLRELRAAGIAATRAEDAVQDADRITLLRSLRTQQHSGLAPAVPPGRFTTCGTCGHVQPASADHDPRCENCTLPLSRTRNPDAAAQLSDGPSPEFDTIALEPEDPLDAFLGPPPERDVRRPDTPEEWPLPPEFERLEAPRPEGASLDVYLAPVRRRLPGGGYVGCMARWYRRATVADIFERLSQRELPHVLMPEAQGRCTGGTVRSYLVERCLDGRTLRAWASHWESTVTGLVAAEHLLHDLTAAVVELDAAGLWHLGLRPETVEVEEGPRNPAARVGGLSGLVTASSLAVHTEPVSLGPYSAPENFHGAADLSSAFWSIGVIFFELIAGRHPYGPGGHSFSDAGVRRWIADHARIGYSGVPEPWQPLLRGLLTHVPELRWGARQIELFLKRQPLPSPPPEFRTQPLAFKLAAGDREAAVTAAELASLFARNWDSAVPFMNTHRTSEWLHQQLGDQALATNVAAIERRADGPPEVKLYQVLEQLDPAQPATFMGWALTTPADVEAIARQALAGHVSPGQLAASAMAVVRALDSHRVLALRSRGAAERALRELNDRWQQYLRQYRDELSSLDPAVSGPAREAARAANNDTRLAFLLACASSNAFVLRARVAVQGNEAALRCNWFSALAGDVTTAAPSTLYLLQSVMGIAAAEAAAADSAEREREDERRRFEAARRRQARDDRQQHMLRGLRGILGSVAGAFLGIPLGLLAAALVAIPLFLVLLIPGLILYIFDIHIFEPVGNLLLVAGPIVGVIVGFIVGAEAAANIATFWAIVLFAAMIGFLAFQHRPVVSEIVMDWVSVSQEAGGMFRTDTPKPQETQSSSQSAAGSGRPAGMDSANWKLTINGLGPIKVGTPLTEAADLLRRSVGPASISSGGSALQVAKAPGIAVVARQDRVTAVKSIGQWRTPSGLSIGDPIERIPDTYGEKVRRVDIEGMPYPAYVYVPREDKDAELRLVFRSTQDGHIESMCAGRLPEVAMTCDVDASAVTGIASDDATNDPGNARDPANGGTEQEQGDIWAFLRQTRPGWSVPQLPIKAVERCTRDGETLSTSVRGDFDGDGRTDLAMLIKSVDAKSRSDRTEIVLFREDRYWDFLTEMPKRTPALLGVLPAGTSFAMPGHLSRTLQSDGLVVVSCDSRQRRFVLVHDQSGWKKERLPD